MCTWCIYLCVCVCVCVSVCPSVCLSVCLSVWHHHQHNLLLIFISLQTQFLSKTVLVAFCIRQNTLARMRTFLHVLLMDVVFRWKSEKIWKFCELISPRRRPSTWNLIIHCNLLNFEFVRSPFPFRISVNSAMWLVITLRLNCLDYFLNQESHSKNGL